jgi:CheY-like chemotaxis protein
VLLQLATNARDAMPDGGTLTFATSDADAHVQLTVSDTGIGIEPATLERVFEPFFTTKELGGGLGLGLSTVYGIVTQSGGRVTAASEPARGTAIQITLPVADGHASARHQVSLPETASVVGTETILLIEDDPALAMLVESFLVRLGYRLIHVPNGSEALRAGRRYGTRIDLMIGNVHAPSASGRLLLDELRLLVPDLPAVLIVDALEPADPGHAGAHTSVLTRPFAMAELASHARTLLDRGLRLEA